MGIEPHNGPQDLLPFERLLAEISTFFINLPAHQIGNEIVAAQKRICELLDIDRSALLLTAQDDPGILLLTHVHQPPGSLPPPDRLNATDFYPWTVPKILSGETVAISKMTELPAEAHRDRESFDLFGTKSAVYIPLSVGKGPVFGVLGFVATRQRKDGRKGSCNSSNWLLRYSPMPSPANMPRSPWKSGCNSKCCWPISQHALSTCPPAR